MPLAPRLLPGGRQPGGHQVPASPLSQSLACAQLPANPELRSWHSTVQPLDLNNRLPAHDQHELREALQRGSLDPALDPADRVLAGARPQGETPLTEPLPLAHLSQKPANVMDILTLHKVSE